MSLTECPGKLKCSETGVGLASCGEENVCLQWFEDWRMPRCFRTVEAGSGRAGLKVITNGTWFALLFCSRGFKVS